MSWKSLTQASLSDTLVNHHKAFEELDSIDLLNDWKAIETLMADILAKKQGEIACPPVLIFKPCCKVGMA
ncbi:MAG: hypothetical protein CTY29_01000 [Methylobacter sp.]|nr:MAG: hypothetical protein CTY29_01000 [Methylobacter sp.]